jgi:arginine decarboxylase-like protein
MLFFIVIYSMAMLIRAGINKKRKDNNKITRRTVRAVSMALAVAPVVNMSFFSLGPDAYGIQKIILVLLIESVAIFFVNKKVQ